MSVRFADEAELDLEDIGDHIALDSPTQAVRVVQQLRAACNDLAKWPMRFSAVTARGRTLRRRSVGRHNVYYLVEDDLVLVIRILHSARDQGAVLFPDD